jgi:small multidrug resistance pump
MNASLFLAAAIALEVTGTFLLKLSNGFEKWHWGALSIFCYSACFWVLAPAMKVLPVGIVYAVWAGVGIVAAALIGVFAFGERLAPVQMVCMALVLVGAVGLRLTTATGATA